MISIQISSRLKPGFAIGALLALALTGFATRRTLACGGFFCSRVPVVQTGEQIIFRRDGARVTAVVQILYQGPSQKFSWVVPVPGIPEVSLASNLMFGPLEQATRPTFMLDISGSACQPIEIPLPLPALAMAAFTNA